MRTLLFAGALFAFLAMALSHQSQDAADVHPPGLIEHPGKNIMIGTCPTLEEDAAGLAERLPGASLVVFGSTQEALGALRDGEIDVAVVGRIASPHELSAGTEERLLKEGYTLVSRNKAGIEYMDLCRIEICTSLPKEAAEEMLPPCARVSYHAYLEGALGCLDSAVLISWDEYSPGLELLVPFENGQKVKKFRTMAAYYPSGMADRISGIFSD